VAGGNGLTTPDRIGPIETSAGLHLVAASAFREVKADGECTTVGDPVAPTPGQRVLREIPTPTPDGSTTTFSTAFPFADGSLKVYVDRLDQTAAVTSYDGAAGTFTLGFAHGWPS
jgi:hypothetical protein